MMTVRIVLERVRSRVVSVKTAINHLFGTALLEARAFQRSLPATKMGQHFYLDYDDVEDLIQYGEGPMHR